MKTSQFLGAVVLSILGVSTGAQAETYQGVQTIGSVTSRSEVAAEARIAARSGDAYSEASYSGVAPAMNSDLSRSTVRVQAAQAARDGNVYGEVASYGFPGPSVGQASRDAVRAEARAAARSTTAFPL